MSVCIIHTDIVSVYISSYMGRLRFTLTNIIFWVVILLSCLLAENIAIFSETPQSGFETLPLYLLSFGIIALLIFYYVLEHKRNGLTMDKILLPCLGVFGLLMIITIFRQGDRTFTNWDATDTFSISFTFSERLLASLQVVIWMMVLYAIVFVYNRFRLNNNSYRWIPKIYLLLTIAFVIIDFFYEIDIISGIFNGTYLGAGVQFVLGNSNVWALVIFCAIISALILSYKRFNWYYFASMICLFCYLIMTTSATAIYIGLVVVLAYPLFEVFVPFKEDKKKYLKRLLIYIGVVLTVFAVFAICISANVPLFANFWRFVDADILHKDFLTITGRTDIWSHIIDLLKQNPSDFIFGLGHQTGSQIFHTYNADYMPVKSAHNAVMEVFLRYGLLGVIVYVIMLGLVIFALVLHIRKKRYRLAFIYGLAFLAILAHSVAESTNIFTPNIGGTYLGLYFALPILNTLQSKKFKELKDDLSSVSVKKERVPALFYVFTVAYVCVSILITKVIYNFTNIDLFSCLVICVLLVTSGLFILSIINNKSLNKVNENIFNHFLRRLEVIKDEK